MSLNMPIVTYLKIQTDYLNPGLTSSGSLYILGLCELYSTGGNSQVRSLVQLVSLRLTLLERLQRTDGEFEGYGSYHSRSKSGGGPRQSGRPRGQVIPGSTLIYEGSSLSEGN